EPDDGAADFIFIAAEGALSAGMIGVSALLGAHLDDPRVLGVRARGATFAFSRPVGIQCDGHEWTAGRARFMTSPGALSVVAPTPEAPPEPESQTVVAVAGFTGDIAVLPPEVAPPEREGRG
ncbi:MAG TPA: hypothetical protein VNC50_18965, partial [Planctomycetia bacterium]|nr:hypothetical protein [Planctomycetia bacterium]